LAKLAARRQAQRQAAERRRRVIAGVVGGVIGLGVIVLGISMLTGDDVPADGATPTPTAEPAGEPQQTGTVELAADLPSKVACGAERPAAADEPKPQFDRAPSPDTILQDGFVYVAVMETSCGTIEIELAPRRAPETVASFVFLAEQGYFDGIPFHRVVDSIDVIQGGDPTGTGAGGPGYSIPDELTGRERYRPGTLAMANAGPNTGGSQFFLITGPEGTNLDALPNYTVFGNVREGLSVAQEINALMPDAGYDGPPTAAAFIESVTIRTEARAEEPPPTP
jgi:cyclophilin family peptidyl-prolyl cis-trans isomerase